ncbi:hypothetical protein FACS1894166_11580 [Bacilli bacterium]|nr:hypothetical protein FACS1894166_11580 [Bacilli bacterium]
MKTITQKHSKATLLKTILSLGAIGLMGTGIAISATYNNHTTLTPNVVSTNKSNINTNTNADAVSIADMIPANT